MINDPIVAEVRAIREKLAAECDFDIGKIVDQAQSRQAASNAKIISFARSTESAEPAEMPAANCQGAPTQ
jgi:hypothetical protein